MLHVCDPERERMHNLLQTWAMKMSFQLKASQSTSLPAWLELCLNLETTYLPQHGTSNSVLQLPRPHLLTLSEPYKQDNESHPYISLIVILMSEGSAWLIDSLTN